MNDIIIKSTFNYGIPDKHNLKDFCIKNEEVWVYTRTIGGVETIIKTNSITLSRNKLISKVQKGLYTYSTLNECYVFKVKDEKITLVDENKGINELVIYKNFPKKIYKKLYANYINHRKRLEDKLFKLSSVAYLLESIKKNSNFKQSGSYFILNGKIIKEK